MNKTRLLHKAKYSGARNNPENVQVNIESTSKPIVPMNIKETVDLYEQYMSEYSECDKYRLTLTIKPYCSNILFNAATEIEKTTVRYNNVTVSVPTNISEVSIDSMLDIYGKKNSLTRDYMVSNTEYSSPDTGFVYHPGYDIFDNHTLRNTSFRPVIYCRTINDESRSIFNTISDVMRNINGTPIEFWPRMSVEDGYTEKKYKHIYEHSNLLSFSDGSSIDANLRSENGWYGFYNASSIEQRVERKAGTDEYSEHVFSHTINNAGNCEFIDMYPDRTLFSLIPKVNKSRNRIEKNWDVFLTYPWKNFTNHNVVKNVKKLNLNGRADGNTNALAVMTVERRKASTNREYVFFRTFTKHGLSVNDKISVFLSKNTGGTYEKLERTYVVDYLGDVDGNYKEYIFGISEHALLDDLFSGEIENIFYSVYQQTVGDCPTVSGQLTEVPDVSTAGQIIQQWYYTPKSPQQTLPQYHDFQTFDEMPQTINVNSVSDIRVWNGEYTKYEYNGSGYVVTQVDGEFGDWNTYTDLPSSYTFNLIRVKQYTYYEKRSRHLKQKSGSISDLINEKFYGNEEGATWCLRIIRQAKGYDCQYYIRKFRKLPNLKYASEPLSSAESTNEVKLLEYFENNACDEFGNMIPFESEEYKLAFAKTIYGDDVMQMTYLDSFTLGELKDNLGRPLTEIYATIVKRNKGYKLWYSDDVDNINYSDSEIEYSHCFGSVTTGIEYIDTDDDLNQFIRNYKGVMSSVGHIHRNPLSNGEVQPLTVEDWDDDNIEKEITENDDEFFGDVVEYSPAEAMERVLSPCCFRFNTAQRELGEEEQYGIVYHEIIYDDYDPNRTEEPTSGFHAAEYEMVGAVKRKEGYYYNPHTRIQLKRFSDSVNQAAHRRVLIKKATPLQSKAMFIKVSTKTMHGLGVGQPIYLCNNGVWWNNTVSDVIDAYTFTLNPVPKDDTSLNGCLYVDWIEVCNGLNDGTYQIRAVNSDIPSYAKPLNENLFVWRRVEYGADFSETDELHFPMSNNALYVDVLADLILKRQDPDGKNGLIYVGDCPDRPGRIRRTSNYEYVPETENQC